MFAKAILITFAIVFVCVHCDEDLDEPRRSPSTMYMRALLGRNRVESPMATDDHYNILRGENSIWPLLEWQGFDFMSLISLMMSDQDRECLRDMKTILTSSFPSKEPWALKYLDSWAKPPAGIMEGNYAWYGDFDQCLDIQPVYLPKQNRTIRPQYCHIGLKPTSSISNNMTRDQTLVQFNEGVMIGLCVSTSCSEETLSIIFSTLVPRSTGLQVSPTSTSCQVSEPPLTKYTYIAIGVCSAIGFFILTGLILDLTIRLRNWVTAWQISARNEADTDPLLGAPKTEQIGESENSAPIPINEGNENGVGADHQPVGDENTQVRVKTPSGPICGRHGICSRILLCFSPYTNISKIFTLPCQSPNNANTPNLNAMHAIRCLSLFWVLLGHCYLFLFASLDNLWVMTEWPKQFAFQFIMSAVFAVDSFFFLSGFFAYWSLSRQWNKEVSGNQKKKSPFWFWKSLPFIYFHRYLRLTPPYLAVIMIDICLWVHLSNGPFYFQGLDMVCIKHWWQNLLYINNFFGMTEQCIGWGWYLAIDMQLFLVAPFLVALFVWRPALGWIASVMAIVGQTAYTIAVTFIMNLPSAPFAPPTGNQTLILPGQPGDTTNFFEWVYIKPYARLGPYVVGIIVGHIVVKHSLYFSRKIFSRPILSTLLWLLWIAVTFVLIYGQFGLNSNRYVNPKLIDAFYNSFSRTVWGVALGWLVIALVTNRAGPIGHVLSWPGWALPAKLSYSAYLVQPLVLLFFAQTARRPFHATDLTMIFMFLGSTVCTFMVATLFSVIFESPVMGLQRLRVSAAASTF